MFAATVIVISAATAYNPGASSDPTGTQPAAMGHSPDEVDLRPLQIDATNNRVGIGTESPGAKLEIEGSGDRLLQVEDTTNNNGLFIGTDDDMLGFIRIRPTSGSGIAITNQGDDIGVFVRASDGDVGIGTTNPASSLEVAGTGITLGGVTRTTWPSGGGACELIVDTFRGPAGNKAAYRTGGATTDTWEPVPVPDYCIGRPCLLYGYYINDDDEMENPRFVMVYQASNVISGGAGGGRVRWYLGIIATGERTNGTSEQRVLELADSLRMWDDKGSEAVCLRWPSLDPEGPLESQKELYRANAISSNTEACDRTDTTNNNGRGGDERESTIWYWAYRDSSVSWGMRMHACRMFN